MLLKLFGSPKFNSLLNQKINKFVIPAQNVTIKKLHSQQVPVKEVRIPTQCGQISAKLWGSGNQRPILALHGWQDNAGTWDPLAPMIADKRPILAIDFPGHGLSSWLPPGVMYFTWMLPYTILQIKEYFEWEKVTLMCHSMGSIAGCRFSCLFPELVDGYISVESIVADDYDLNCVIDRYPIHIQKCLKAQTLLDKEPPSYSYEDIKKIWHLGTSKSVSLDSVPYLLKRGSKPSKADPNKFYFSRDSRLKYVLFNPEDKAFVQTLLLKLQCPTLFIKGKDSPYSTDPFVLKMRELVAQNNKNFESHTLPGTHHLHLNDPQNVAPFMQMFLDKYNLFDVERVQAKSTL